MVSQCVSAAVFFSPFFDHLHKYGSLWWEGNCVFDGGEGEWGRLVGVWVEGGLRTSTCLVCFLRARARTPLSVRLIPHVVLVEKKSLITVVCEDSCH